LVVSAPALVLGGPGLHFLTSWAMLGNVAIWTFLLHKTLLCRFIVRDKRNNEYIKPAM
jgi:hypothetical protein